MDSIILTSLSIKSEKPEDYYLILPVDYVNDQLEDVFEEVYPIKQESMLILSSVVNFF